VLCHLSIGNGTPRLLSDQTWVQSARQKSLGKLSLILFGCSVSALLVFKLIGSRVDRQGVLREPFFLLPFSALLAGAGVATGTAAIAWRPKRNDDSSPKIDSSD
jgi:hypothetical protein